MKQSLPILLWAILSCPVFCSAQISGESIARYCAVDSGNPSSQYLDYGNDLARTLNFLRPGQLKSVFREIRTVRIPRTLNEQLALNEINFDYGSPNLTESGMGELNKVVEFLSLNTEAEVLIEGHVQFEHEGAQALSEQRAEAARQYLIQLGISSDRIEARGLGATVPLVTGGRTTAGTEVNRRVEIIVQE